MSHEAWLSPLRYPGAQRRLVPFIRSVLHNNDLQPALFIEPFAGGSSVAIQLLGEGTVRRIGLADKDPLVTAFWKVVFNDSVWLVDRIRETEPSVEEWKTYKKRSQSDNLTLREQAFICLYLNRTSFSGILHPQAGPLGGYSQASEHSIDCRFPKEVLVNRILSLRSLAERVEFVWNKSWKATLSMVSRMKQRGSLPASIFYYLDPPFFEKSQKLYTHRFHSSDHQALRDRLVVTSDYWLLSYDDSEKVWDHYGNLGLEGGRLDFLYGPSENGGPKTNGRNPYSEAIVTNLTDLPSSVVLWDKGGRRGIASLTSRNG